MITLPQLRENPFPGLRPFTEKEAYLFFGRESQVDEVLRRLQRSQFLAVVGTSGCGKSSLVRAGLLPSLHSDTIRRTGSRWRVAIFRPGGDPIGNLATALSDPQVLGKADVEPEMRSLIIETTLRRSSLGLVEVMKRAPLDPDENLLIVVDQFEELFRFKQSTRNSQATNESTAFVNLLLEASGNHSGNHSGEHADNHSGASIYVMLTLRSDFLGDCAQFRDLPEALNDNQYLIPRMTREQRRRVIEGPIAVAEGEITPRLVSQLLNDVGDNPDQLPVLQHALMRTWNQWEAAQTPDKPLDLPHYQAIGGMDDALSIHADEIYLALDPKMQRVAEKLFKCLTEKGPDNREIRRPTPLAEVCRVAGATPEDVSRVVEAFRAPGRTFVMPPAGIELTEERILDISHESFIRVWQRLKHWVDDEGQAAQTYCRLAQTAVLQAKGNTGYLQNPELTNALEWYETYQPNEAWGKRYAPNFKQAEQFLRQSKERQRVKNRTIGGLVILVLLGLTGNSLFLQGQLSRIENQQLRALTSTANSKYEHNKFSMNTLQASVEVGRFLKDTVGDRRISERAEVLKVLGQSVNWVMEWHQWKGHDDAVQSVGFSPDGEFIVTTSYDNTAKLWRPDGSLIQSLAGHSDTVMDVDISNDGQLLVTANADGTLKRWYRETTDEISPKGEQTLFTSKAKDILYAGSEWFFTSVDISPDGQQIVAGTDLGNVLLSPVESEGVTPPIMNHQDAVWDVRFSPNGKIIASASQDKTVKIWTLEDEADRESRSQNENEITPPRTLSHDQVVRSLNFSPTEEQTLVAASDERVVVWDLSSGTQANTFPAVHKKDITDLQFSPDGQQIATASKEGTVILWNLDGTVRVSLAGHEDRVNQISFSPTAPLLASVSNDQTIRLWQTEVNRPTLSAIFEPGLTVNSIAVSPTDKQIIAIAAGQEIQVRQTDGQLLKNFPIHVAPVNSLSFSPDGQSIASASDDGTAKVTSLEGSELLKIEEEYDFFYKARFSPDGQTLATASSGDTAKLWDLKAQEIGRLQGHEAEVFDIQFSPNGKNLVTASADGTARLWNVQGNLLTALQGHEGPVYYASFSPNGQIIATAGNDKTIKLWNLEGTLLHTLEGHAARLFSVSFSLDGETLASASKDKTIKLWDVDTGLLITTLVGHEDGVNSIHFSADGQSLISGGDDNKVLIWDIKALTSLDQLLIEGCKWMSDFLTTNPDEGAGLCPDTGPPDTGPPDTGPPETNP